MERETDRLRSSRDRAIVELLLRTGLRIGELADLDAGDVRLTQRTGELVIRHGKGDRHSGPGPVIVTIGRMPGPHPKKLAPGKVNPDPEEAQFGLQALNPEGVREALCHFAAASSRSTAPPGGAAAMADRPPEPSDRSRARSGAAVDLRAGEQLSLRSITKLVSKVMAAAGVQETAHGLRHTLAPRLVRDHCRDLALVAGVLGHADVATTRPYVRSELEDRRAALEALDR